MVDPLIRSRTIRIVTDLSVGAISLVDRVLAARLRNFTDLADCAGRLHSWGLVKDIL